MSDDPLAQVRAAATRYKRLADADEKLRQAVVDALKNDVPQVDVIEASGRPRETIRRWAREAGIPPAPRGGYRTKTRREMS
jgi:hypothetical protein